MHYDDTHTDCKGSWYRIAIGPHIDLSERLILLKYSPLSSNGGPEFDCRGDAMRRPELKLRCSHRQLFAPEWRAMHGIAPTAE